MFGIAETNSLITRRPFAVSGALVSLCTAPRVRGRRVCRARSAGVRRAV